MHRVSQFLRGLSILPRVLHLLLKKPFRDQVTTHGDPILSSAQSYTSKDIHKMPSTVADMYFYTELRSSLGHKDAERWLSGSSASCVRSSIQASRCQSQTFSTISAADTPRSRSPFSSSECLASGIERSLSGVPALLKCHSVMPFDESHECDMLRLIHEHGEKAGLLFTDAAHELLDSPRSSASNDDWSSR